MSSSASFRAEERAACSTGQNEGQRNDGLGVSRFRAQRLRSDLVLIGDAIGSNASSSVIDDVQGLSASTSAGGPSTIETAS